MRVRCGQAWRRVRHNRPGMAGECRFFWEVLKMRPMTLLASALFTSLVAATATVEVGCSSDDTATTPLTPFDSGTVVVPEAGPGAPAR